MFQIIINTFTFIGVIAVLESLYTVWKGDWGLEFSIYRKLAKGRWTNEGRGGTETAYLFIDYNNIVVTLRTKPDSNGTTKNHWHVWLDDDQQGIALSDWLMQKAVSRGTRKKIKTDGVGGMMADLAADL